MFLDVAPEVALQAAAAEFRRQRFRVDVHPDAIAGERGYLRETGNLLFHASVLVVLISFAYGRMFGFVGGAIVVTGDSFSNSASQYDDFAPGALFNPDRLTPFNVKVDAFHVQFVPTGPEAGQPTSFAADLTYQAGLDTPARHYTLRVNHPLNVAGTDIFLVGHGYAPVVTVRDGTGEIAYRGPVVFLPEDGTFQSIGVLKVPDARPDQLGFEGQFLPTYSFSRQTGPYSAFPDALNPVLTMGSYHGNLGLNDGVPQSVYVLDKSRLTPFKRPDGQNFRVRLPLGKTVRLPHGAGTIRFDRVDRFVKLQISQSPGKLVVLSGVLLGILGMLGSLYVRPKRVWARVGVRDGSTSLEVAGLNRGRHGDIQSDINDLTSRIQHRAQETA